MKIGKFNLRCPISDASLPARFAFHSFICIGLMTTALWFIVSNYLISQMLEREWEFTARMVRADVRQMLEDYDFTATDRKSVGHKFDALLKHMTIIPDILRFKVYNPNGVVIWSDDKRLVGKAFMDNEELLKALRGQVVADVSKLEKKENVFEQGEADGNAIEVYVPVYSDHGGKFLGVVETYKRPNKIYADIRNARAVVLMGALGGGLLLYFSLYAIVRQAARKIDEQQSNLLSMQSELIASQRMAAVGEMAAAVAHGIGNPLSSIRAAAQVGLLDAVNGADAGMKTRASLESIMRQVDRVQKRMQGLLNFARPLEPRPSSVDVNSLLRDVVETLRPKFTGAGVTSRLELDAGVPRVLLDVNHLEQVFMGLVNNAIEATPKGGQVTVRTKPLNGTGNAVSVSVEDTGEGIPPENRERIFEPFFTTKPQGTGIGLPLAKKFVERNGGTITIAEGRGHGTKIDVALPSVH